MIRSGGGRRIGNGKVVRRRPHIATVIRRKSAAADRMAWPKKHTRKIVVDGDAYQWHRSRKSLYVGDDRITVGTSNGRFFLFIDPFPHDFVMRPGTIVDAIRWAVKNGWNPEDGPTRELTYPDDATGFMWLPEGARSCFDLDANQCEHNDSKPKSG